MICIPIKQSDYQKFLGFLDQAQEQGDIIEIYFQEIQDLDQSKIDHIFAQKRRPFLFKYSPSSSFVFLDSILERGVEYLDLDLETDPATVARIKKDYSQTKIILSYHNFEETPQELSLIAERAHLKGADIIKIATQANSFLDSLRMLRFLSQLSSRHPCICLCMGEEGKITRATGHLFGNYLTFAPLNEDQKTAAGQYTFSQLQQIHNLL